MFSDIVTISVITSNAKQVKESQEQVSFYRILIQLNFPIKGFDRHIAPTIQKKGLAQCKVDPP